MSTSLAPFPVSATERNRVEISDYTTPRYEAEHRAGSLSLSVFLPGVRSPDIEVTLRGPDLIVTARRPHIPRVNFRAANLEAVQHDYRLVLRVGHGFDLRRLQAALEGGILSLELPRAAGASSRFEPRLKVA